MIHLEKQIKIRARPQPSPKIPGPARQLPHATKVRHTGGALDECLGENLRGPGLSIDGAAVGVINMYNYDTSGGRKKVFSRLVPY